ncbi:3-deoxy-D-arabinoheptulosonate-7-phosphate synthase /chorismate mutase [Streptohalobacillus salinus]|uniref:3-deoxy-D-arabinoheptulosonate-7-phosphate synthase /chorismate mutase n=1 Tax=Streptohalobacillus salinus TaxID=621096 RepID=A0A2V3WHA6_9BACI|nr:bifunctional 3-deoxy-7-phosphoheptulonate synthase/chorismate mutase [Streptohalobacillus salinus]PXW88169.1 3-deoxy-D-arabinoheptulosonate-7-phosphate synthase /chorismate mutase [Streptohalobacillus salinus]
MSNEKLDSLRDELDQVNMEILSLINRRGELVKETAKAKVNQGPDKKYDPVREHQMLEKLKNHNEGPFQDATIIHLFKEIFKAGLELQEKDYSKEMLVSRKRKVEDTVIDINGEKIGDGNPHFVCGPCAVESYEQVAKVAEQIKKHGLNIIRGGAFKPRTSPYDFQGLGFEGLEILKRVGDEYGLAVVSEIVRPQDMEQAAEYLDMIQIGARNMQNFELLKAAGEIDKPIILKRGMSATVSDFINAAEYINSKGNGNIILCERGIRTYETSTRNTLDITAVPILKQETHLPVMVDVTHSTGRRDLLIPAAKAAIAIGADAIMAEVHPDPAVALSDQQQQMDFDQFDTFMKTLK